MAFVFTISQPLAPCGAVMISLPPTAIYRLSSIEESKICTSQNYPKIVTISPSKIDKIRLTNQQIKQFDIIVKKCMDGSITMEEAILELRGGDDLTDVAAIITFIIFVNWYDSLFGVKAFQGNPLPHMDPFGWSSGKYNSRNSGQSSSNTPSRFERETFHQMRQMCSASADENGFMMSYDNAYNLIKETYTGSMGVTEEFKISDWQATSHVYHGNGVGVNPEDFGITQAKLDKIRDGGLIAYARRGNKLPSMEHVRAYKKALKNICTDSANVRRDDSKYYSKNGVYPTTVFKNSRYLICFNQDTGDLITGDKQRRGSITKFERTNQLGSRKWIDKWSK